MSNQTSPDGGGTVISRIGKYELLEKIGAGTFGEVYRARHVLLGSEVAVKLLLPKFSRDEEVLERFLREAKTMASLPDYRHVVRVFDLDEAKGRPFYAMEYIPLTLSKHLGGR
jgi:serine/threonine-protein kinase